MDDLQLGKEVSNRPAAEPLLPIEKKLIGISLGLGLGLLALLFALTRG